MSQTTTEYVAAEVRAEMGRQNVDNAWLAEALSKSDMWVSRRLRGITEFSADDVVQTARALRISITQLLPCADAEPTGPMAEARAA